MHHDETTRSIQQFNHLCQTHFIKSECEKINYDFLCNNSFREWIIELLRWIEKNHIFPSRYFLRWPHLAFKVCFYNFSRPMSARSSNEHTNSCCDDICFTNWNGNIDSLAKCSFVSLIDINNWIWLQIINPSYYLILILANRNNKSLWNLGVPHLRL